MKYPIKIITNQKQIDSCDKLNISYALWNTSYIPQTYGQIAYFEPFGFIVKLTCLESNPRAIYTRRNDPVFKDSAMEFFFKPYSASSNYLNFEINANGAMLLQIGGSRSGRMPVSEETASLCTVQTVRLQEKWSVTISIPFLFLQKMYPSISPVFKEQDTFRFNLYKILEAEDNAHFLSFTKIESPFPNFHLPDFFADGIIRI